MLLSGSDVIRYEKTMNRAMHVKDFEEGPSHFEKKLSIGYEED